MALVTRWTLALTTLIVVVAVTGCGPTPHTSTEGTVIATVPKMHLTIFELSGGMLGAKDVVVPKTEGVAGAALHALGIDATVTISGGTATVDLASATDEQVAEIVYTLTQFASIQRVDVAGKTGLTRADETPFVAPILIESPADGASVSGSFTVSGSASVFEATLVVEVVASGKTLVHQTITASEGAPDRGTFSATLHIPTSGPVELIAYAPSAADGSPQHKVIEQLYVRS